MHGFLYSYVISTPKELDEWTSFCGNYLFTRTSVQTFVVLVAVQAGEFSLAVLTCKGFKTSVKTKMTLVASKIRENFPTISTL